MILSESSWVPDGNNRRDPRPGETQVIRSPLDPASVLVLTSDGSPAKRDRLSSIPLRSFGFAEIYSTTKTVPRPGSPLMLEP